MGAISMFSPVFEEADMRTAVTGLQKPGRSLPLTRKQIQGILWLAFHSAPFATRLMLGQSHVGNHQIFVECKHP